jgi:hypothetical protein
MTILDVKAEIFDYIRVIEAKQKELQELIVLKNEALKKLQELEKNDKQDPGIRTER